MWGGRLAFGGGGFGCAFEGGYFALGGGEGRGGVLYIV